MPFSILSNREISAILAKRIDQQKQAVGMVVGVIDFNGPRVVTYGKLAQDDPRTLDGDTIFEIGSVTKVFTSLLLADMVNRNEVALDDPASKYFPDHVRMPERNGKSITLLDLSTHTSGLPRVPSNLKPKDHLNPYADYSLDDLYQFLSSYTLTRDPGSEFEYSNLGGGLLGHLLATRAGMDYESLVRTRITGPLNMPDTGITLSSSMKQRMATGHSGILTPTPNWDFPTLAGAGALRSSVNDILTFLEAVLVASRSKVDQGSPLASAMNAMLEVRRPMGQGKAETGLGWVFMPVHDREIVCHDGGTGGFRSWVGFDLKEGTGVVVLCNAATIIGGFDIGLHLLDPKWPLANPEPPVQRIAIAIDPARLDHYTGRYQVEATRVFELIRDGDRLFAQVTAQATTLGTDQPVVGPRFEVFAEGENKFFVKATGSQISFETGPDGRVTGLIMQRTGREPTSAPRLP